MKSPRSVLFLGKADDPFCQQAEWLCRNSFADVKSFSGVWGDPLPEEAREWNGDVIISYLSRWVVPQVLLSSARVAAINFHPASPDFPGIGCCNFALYQEAPEYGATCHHMFEKVDTGPIIKVRRFPLFQTDDVASLLDRTYSHQFALFAEIIGVLKAHRELPVSSEVWSRRPFTRAEFNQLNCIRDDMDAAEVQRRIRACAFGQYFPRRIPAAA